MSGGLLLPDEIYEKWIHFAINHVPTDPPKYRRKLWKIMHPFKAARYNRIAKAIKKMIGE